VAHRCYTVPNQLSGAWYVAHDAGEYRGPHEAPG
jgi:hypothetical protein